MFLVFYKEEYSGKIFCIGFNKTGTTSLGKSLELLGYRNSSFNRVVWRKYYKKNEIVKILKYTSKFDSFDDLPWLNIDMIPILDKVFPKSKYIYLERDEESWLKSIDNWTFKKTDKHPDLEEKLNEFRIHRDFVMEFLSHKESEDYIILNIKDSAGFKKLANFLGIKSISDEFPHHNKT